MRSIAFVLSILCLVYTTGSYGAEKTVRYFSPALTGDDAVCSGDVNCDNRINVFDLLALLKHLQDPTSAPQSADLDGNGLVDIYDLASLLECLSNPAAPKYYAITGETLGFYFKVGRYNNVFRMVVNTGTLDTLIVVIPPAENKSYLRLTRTRIEQAARVLNSAAYAAYRVKPRAWNPVVFTPALDSAGVRSRSLMVLPDSGVSVSLETVESNEGLLDSLGFTVDNRICRLTAAGPDNSIDWAAFFDSLDSSGPQQSYALLEIKVKDPDQPDSTGPQLSTQPPRGEVEAYILENGIMPGPFDEYHLILDKSVTGDGTVYWGKTTEVRTGDSLIVIVNKKCGYKYSCHLGFSDTLIPESNITYKPEIHNFDQLYEATPRIEKESDGKRYLVLNPLKKVSYYCIIIYADGIWKGQYFLYDPVKFLITDLEANTIYFEISAVYLLSIFGRTVNYAYEPAQDSLYQMPY